MIYLKVIRIEDDEVLVEGQSEIVPGWDEEIKIDGDIYNAKDRVYLPASREPYRYDGVPTIGWLVEVYVEEWEGDDTST